MSSTVADELAVWLGRIRGYVIDMDGVLYRGDTLLPHVQDFLLVLDERQIPYSMATNNSMRTPQQYVDKLARMGVTVQSDRILTSGLATRGWLQEHFPKGTRMYVIGMAALQEAIFGDGYYQPAGVDADVVVTGADFDLTYEKLRVATLAIRRGARYVSTNADTTFPTEEGLIPGAGAIIAALVAATEVEPVVIGKPAPGMLVEAAETLGTKPDETAMLGDRLDTDILGGQRAGLVTLLVLTGVTDRETLAESEIQPDVILPDLSPLVTHYTHRE